MQYRNTGTCDFAVGERWPCPQSHLQFVLTGTHTSEDGRRYVDAKPGPARRLRTAGLWGQKSSVRCVSPSSPAMLSAQGTMGGYSLVGARESRPQGPSLADPRLSAPVAWTQRCSSTDGVAVGTSPAGAMLAPLQGMPTLGDGRRQVEPGPAGSPRRSSSIDPASGRSRSSPPSARRTAPSPTQRALRLPHSPVPDRHALPRLPKPMLSPGRAIPQ